MPQAVDPDPWLEAARQYARLDNTGRASYWSQLDLEQQAALTSALQRIAVPASAAPVASERKGGGIFSIATVGCLGFVLGVVLTIAVQVVGLQRLVPELLRPSPSSMSRSGESPSDDAPALEYLTSDCSGPPKSHDEELFCQMWKQVHPKP